MHNTKQCKNIDGLLLYKWHIIWWHILLNSPQHTIIRRCMFCFSFNGRGNFYNCICHQSFIQTWSERRTWIVLSCRYANCFGLILLCQHCNVFKRLNNIRWCAVNLSLAVNSWSLSVCINGSITPDQKMAVHTCLYLLSQKPSDPSISVI